MIPPIVALIWVLEVSAGKPLVILTILPFTTAQVGVLASPPEPVQESTLNEEDGRVISGGKVISMLEPAGIGFTGDMKLMM